MTKKYFDNPYFRQFIAPDCDRKTFIQNFLNKAGLEAPVIQLEGKNHIYVKFPLSQYNSMFKIKTVIAHYDRVENSPGANDNSAAVFTIMNWAAALAKMQTFHNVRIIFTDGEELGSGGVNQQGAFALAQVFKKLGIVNDDIYVFDCMGRGNIPIICTHDLPKGISGSFIKKYNKLENNIEEIVKKGSGGKWFKLNTSYSDNASFISNGIPAVAVTMLPSVEVETFLHDGIEPKTWSMFHTKDDNLENLTEESFEIFYNILCQIGVNKSLLDFT